MRARCALLCVAAFLSRVAICFPFLVTAALGWGPAQETLSPQNGVPPEIRGSVRDRDTALAVEGADVTLSRLNEKGFEAGSSDKLVTGADGAFTFKLEQLGHYRVSVQKSGYSFAPAADASVDVNLDSKAPTIALHFSIVGSGRLSGRVIDADTGKPAPNVRLAILTCTAANGRRRAGPPHANVATDLDGEYSAKGLPPGSYVVYVTPRVLGKEQLLTGFSSGDLETIDTDYADSYWPGGLDLDAAIPFAVTAGSEARLSDITVRTVPYFRVHFSVPTASCAEGDSLSVARVHGDGFFGGVDPLGAVPCGKEFLLRNVSSGSYKLLLEVISSSGAVRLSGTVEYLVTDHNVDLTPALQQPVGLRGRLLVADSVKAPRFDRISVSMVLLELSRGRVSAPATVEGDFRIEGAELGTQRIGVEGLVSPYYVKEIRFNGQAVSSGILALTGSGFLDVVLDDKPGAMTGTVRDGDDPVAKPYVLIVSWPPYPAQIFLSVRRTGGDDGGIFQAGGLPPGEYRVLAVSQTTRYKIEEPGVLQRLLGSAERVTVGPGSVQNVQLKLTDPLR